MTCVRTFGCESRTNRAFCRAVRRAGRPQRLRRERLHERRGAEEQKQPDGEEADEDRAIESLLDPAVREGQQQPHDARRYQPRSQTADRVRHARPTTWSARSATTRTRCPRAQRRTTCWPAPAARKARQRSARRRSAAAAARARTPHRSGRSPPPSRPQRHRPARPRARRALQTHPGPAGLGRPLPLVHSWSPLRHPRASRPDLSLRTIRQAPGAQTVLARQHAAAGPRARHVGFHGARRSPSVDNGGMAFPAATAGHRGRYFLTSRDACRFANASVRPAWTIG